ncbi:MAG: PqqD family protein [Lachnospiraceae bacterium]|nr:PqqD family protein [Lachnospiraceae bacterium]
MKLKEGFVLRTISGQTVVIPTGEDLDLSMMIKLNDTGRFIWEHLEKGTEIEELVEDMLEEYDVSRETAVEYIEQFVQKVKANGFLA